jgi:hypothetical protein
MRRGNDHRECLRGILSPSNEGTDILLDPSLGDNSTSFRMGDNLKWGKVGGIMDLRSISNLSGGT